MRRNLNLSKGRIGPSALADIQMHNGRSEKGEAGDQLSPIDESGRMPHIGRGYSSPDHRRPISDNASINSVRTRWELGRD